MASKEILYERRMQWAQATTNGRFQVEPGQLFPRVAVRDKRPTYSFCGVGIEVMLNDTRNFWMLADGWTQDRVLNVIEDTTERLCEYYGLDSYDVDMLFGDKNDIQNEAADVLAKQLLEFDYVVDEDADGNIQGASPKPTVDDVAGFAYYSRAGDLKAISVGNPVYPALYICHIAGEREPTHISGLPHREVCRISGSPVPFTVMPLFWSRALRAAIADRLATWVRYETTPEKSIQEMLVMSTYAVLVGDYGPYGASDFQPAASLVRSSG